MKVEIKIDENQKEPRVIVKTDKITDEINEIVKKISSVKPWVIVGFCENSAEILDKNKVLRIYAENGKTYAETGKKKYNLRMRLYELEEKLESDKFVRISNSEIINLSAVKGFDLSFAGTICVSLSNGTVTYVSRRYVSRIKQVLGL